MEPNWKCGLCSRKYVALGKWYEKHCLKHHEGVMKAKRIKFFEYTQLRRSKMKLIKKLFWISVWAFIATGYGEKIANYVFRTE